jgi:hypothetical protein
MTNARTAKQRRAAARRAHDRRQTLTISIIVVAVVATGVFLAVARPGSDTSATGSSSLAKTGEINSMGLPVVETPGHATGATTVDGVRVRGADWSLGTVPLLVAVRPSWTLTNTSKHPVQIGQPNAVVRQGCCPGPFTVGETTLPPGQSTDVTFELAMHPGMDGWHDIGVTVPVTSSDGRQGSLELGVTGDFTGAYDG